MESIFLMGLKEMDMAAGLRRFMVKVTSEPRGLSSEDGFCTMSLGGQNATMG